MKNVKSANYWQVDHKIKNILKAKKVVVLTSPGAWKKFKWARKWFERKPKEGYFIWVRQQVDFPLTTCITIASPKISQDLTNLLVIEKGISVQANVICNAAKNNLCGTHRAQGKLILKNGACLKYNHFHRWGNKDFISPDYQFILEENSRLLYTYENLFPPQNLELKTTIHSQKNSSSNLSFVINGLNSKIGLEDTVFLEGQNSQGLVRLRLVGRENSQIKAISKIVAQSPGKGHLDCQGLLIDKNSTISLIPELICKNKQAQITHEASIGRISEEQLNYLRQRGLSEEEAINLVITGFLKVKKQGIYSRQNL
jgi:Fe-S cluster assembly scaffold protein SufB